jgi:hypothetical protein
VYKAYVWNRVGSESLNENIRLGSAIFADYSVLAGEISWSEKAFHLERISLPIADKNIRSLSLRINSFSGDISTQKDAIVASAKELLESASNAGFSIEELQLDFDCPTSKLDNYRRLLEAFR